MFFLTLVLTIIIFGGTLFLFYWARSQRYRLNRRDVIRLLEMVLSGQATDNDWRLFSALPLHHNPELDAVRDRCLEIEEREYVGKRKSGLLFSEQGLSEIREVLEELRAADF
jgi:hypothetical protein